MEAILETKKLSHIYSAGTPFQRTALDSVDFQAYPGEYLGIIGHTGSGKSTLIQHLNGLLKPTSGQVLFQGTDIWSDLKTTRRTRFQVGLVFQYPEYQLFEETVYKDISRRRSTGGCGRRPTLWACGTTSSTSPPSSSPVARSAGWPSPGSSPWSPRCSFWTSPPPDWTRWGWSPS